MTHLKMLLFPSVNSLFKHQKLTKQASIFRHSTHQMTHGLTHDLGLKSIIVSLLAAGMAVTTNLFVGTSQKLFFPLFSAFYRFDNSCPNGCIQVGRSDWH